ncbi:MAG: hypothetical protein ACT4NL_08515 [Pseudomarimonas sp.]
MPRSVLYYAIGGGLGHLTRAVAFLRQHGLADEALILSASEYLDDLRITVGIPTRRVPDQLQHAPEKLRDWLTRCIAEQQPTLICVDSFPGGILGELCGLSALAGIPLWYVARLLRWDDYAALLTSPTPRYAKTWQLETLHAAHAEFVRENSDEVCGFLLAATSEGAAGTTPPVDRYWLVLHSGPPSEVAQLIAYADEMRRIEAQTMRILIASRQPPSSLPDACTHIDAYPATALITHAERIISAAGFNVMRDTAGVRDRQRILPFPRRYDDQFERARRVLRETAENDACHGTPDNR